MSASLPNPRAPLIDNRGLITPEWYRFLAQFLRDFGDETVPGSGLANSGGFLGIADNGVSNGKLRDSIALSVMGRPLNSAGDPQDIQAGANGWFLQRDGDMVVFRLPKLPSYTVAGAPSASGMGAGSMIYVSNESGGAVPAFSDGTDWRRFTDRVIIS
jgi:hypothetical protein